MSVGKQPADQPPDLDADIKSVAVLDETAEHEGKQQQSMLLPPLASLEYDQLLPICLEFEQITVTEGIG